MAAVAVRSGDGEVGLRDAVPVGRCDVFEDHVAGNANALTDPATATTGDTLELVGGVAFDRDREATVPEPTVDVRVLDTAGCNCFKIFATPGW